MELQTLMRNPKVSTREKHNAVKKHVLDILKEVMECIEKEDYDAIEQYWSYSATGDGYGDENCFIDFNYIDNNSDGMDIHTITSILFGLKKREKKEYEQRRSQLFKQTRKEHPDWGNKRVKTYCNSILEIERRNEP